MPSVAHVYTLFHCFIFLPTLTMKKRFSFRVTHICVELNSFFMMRSSSTGFIIYHLRVYFHRIFALLIIGNKKFHLILVVQQTETKSQTFCLYVKLLQGLGKWIYLKERKRTQWTQKWILFRIIIHIVHVYRRTLQFKN